MSDMHFREPNQVKWLGSRPGHNGTQVLAGVQTAVVGWTILYTVLAGETFFLTFASLGNFNNLSASLSMAIYDDGGVIDQYLGGYFTVAGQVGGGFVANFWPPIELAAAFSVRAHQLANCGMIAAVHGWAE